MSSREPKPSSFSQRGKQQHTPLHASVFFTCRNTTCKELRVPFLQSLTSPPCPSLGWQPWRSWSNDTQTTWQPWDRNDLVPCAKLRVWLTSEMHYSPLLSPWASQLFICLCSVHLRESQGEVSTHTFQWKDLRHSMSSHAFQRTLIFFVIYNALVWVCLFSFICRGCLCKYYIPRKSTNPGTWEPVW